MPALRRSRVETVGAQHERTLAKAIAKANGRYELLNRGGQRVIEKLLVPLDRDQHCSWPIAIRDDQLLCFASLKASNRLRKLSGGSLRRQEFVKPNAHSHGVFPPLVEQMVAI
jgi:hypothetical protein